MAPVREEHIMSKATPAEAAELEQYLNPWPEPEPIREQLSPVHPLHPDMIPDPLRPWATDAAWRMGCPLDFIAVPGVVVLSCAIGTGCRIRPKRHDDWAVVP